MPGFAILPCSSKGRLGLVLRLLSAVEEASAHRGEHNCVETTHLVPTRVPDFHETRLVCNGGRPSRDRPHRRTPSIQGPPAAVVLESPTFSRVTNILSTRGHHKHKI
ncbi:uncharacterized protein LY79DRAFT_535396 [Colletotrichum navitas]|uniref:Secreted protein n=1 Tax=Colletotrichum navitas TaxID=681940 RepID=A0AAD8VCH1_9PEZI|nr:uncharacterized protein LY79DRAFT_535396 [Colletotrichum navitas]KAK1599540.1 hypothetical protein LY79DRAFT_535396 [Colletotrichum navitas]